MNKTDLRNFSEILSMMQLVVDKRAAEGDYQQAYELLTQHINEFHKILAQFIVQAEEN